jgi:hypothetical protein
MIQPSGLNPNQSCAAAAESVAEVVGQTDIKNARGHARRELVVTVPVINDLIFHSGACRCNCHKIWIYLPLCGSLQNTVAAPTLG